MGMDSRVRIFWMQRTFTRPLIAASVAIFVCCVATDSLSGQTDLKTQPLGTPAVNVPMEPSPLSQYSSNGDILSHASKIAGPKNANQGDRFATRKFDFSVALKKYAQVKKCSLNEAFVATVSFLKLQPHDQVIGNQRRASSGLYRMLEKDIYLISGSERFLDSLPAQLLCVENGIRYIEMKVHFVSVPAEDKFNIQRFVIPGSYKTFNNRLPQATPFATQASYRDEANSKLQDPKPTQTMVMATETVTKAFPTFMARMDAKGAEKFMGFAKGDVTRNLITSPTVRAIPGVAVSVSDGATRPFVVGVNLIEGDFLTAHKPVIQPIEDGLLLKIRAVGENGKIRIDGDLALSDIEEVEAFEYSDSKGTDSRKVTVQVPEHRLRQVHLTTLVEEGNSIFLEAFGPEKTQYRLPKRGLAKAGKIVERKMRTMILLSPRWVDAQQH